LVRLLDDRPDTDRPRPSSHRQHNGGRGPLRLSSRLALTAAFTAALLLAAGIAVGTGAVKTPLSDTDAAQLPRSVTLATSPALIEPSASASSFGYAVASVPATHKAKPKPKPKPKVTPSPSVTPSMTPSSTPSTQQSTASDTLTPQNTAEYQTPSGQNQLAWSEAILTALGAPLTDANILSIGYWMQNEAGSPPYGIVGANNPINVSQSCCGGVPIQSDGDGVTFLQSYPTATDGIEATADYLERGNYTGILAALRAGDGLGGSDLASEISLYSGGGYSTIPDSYGSSQGTPETP
jgi:hypothetical protein